MENYTYIVTIFLQPKPLRPATATSNKVPTSLRKKTEQSYPKLKNETQSEIIKAQEVEIR